MYYLVLFVHTINWKDFVTYNTNWKLHKRPWSTAQEVIILSSLKIHAFLLCQNSTCTKMDKGGLNIEFIRLTMIVQLRGKYLWGSTWTFEWYLSERVSKHNVVYLVLWRFLKTLCSNTTLVYNLNKRLIQWQYATLCPCSPFIVTGYWSFLIFK